MLFHVCIFVSITKIMWNSYKFWDVWDVSALASLLASQREE